MDNQPRAIALVDHLCSLLAECQWVEFKRDNTDPSLIGTLISAMSNAARLTDQPMAYVLWGIDDETHSVVGTNFEPTAVTVQKQPLEFWLAQRLKPSLLLNFKVIAHPSGRVVLLEFPAATIAPVEFDRIAHIRIASSTPRLSDHPDRPRALWAALQPFAWEAGYAATYVTADEVLTLLDYSTYFRLTAQTLPDGKATILDRMRHDKLITEDVNGKWNITNLGAMLFAQDLDKFPSGLARKQVRLVAYTGHSRADAVTKRHDESKGYANSFQGLLDIVNGLLPKNEHIDGAFRVEKALYPEIAIRELLANALIHQDMTISGSGPKIELFKDRMEITNPGKPLIEPSRFIDTPPRSRNETLAALMRRMKICEEDGTGVDKVIRAAELYQLPAPDFRDERDAVQVTLYAPLKFADMTIDERVRACYQHATLKYLSGDRMKNSTLRERFGIESHNSAQVSAVIRKALDLKLIRSADPDRPQAAYVPFWG